MELDDHTVNDELTALVARAGDDPDAFTALYHRLRGAVRRHIRAHLPATLPDRDDVLADLCQATWVKVWRALAGLDPRNVAGWVMTIAHRTLIDWARRRRCLVMVPWDAAKHDRLAVDDADPARVVEAAEERAATRARVRAALAALPDDARLALLLTEQEGLGILDQAAAQGIGTSAVKTRRSRAKEAARPLLAGAA